MSSLDFDHLDSFNQSGLKTRLTKKQKIVIAVAAVLVIVLAVLLCVKGCGGSSGARDNTLSLVRMYIERGEYERALDKLEELLLKNAGDKEALDLMDAVIAEKNRASSGDASSANVRVEVDTDGLTQVIESMKSGIERNNRAAEQNSRAMADLLSQQKAQAEMEKTRLEEQKKQQKLAEEQRKKDEAAKKAAEEKRKAEEEALKKKNAQLNKEISFVNDEIQQGKAALQAGSIDKALSHFETARNNLPVSDGEPAFSAGKYSEMAQALHNSSQNAASGEVRNRLEEAAVSYAQNAISLNPKDAASNYIIGADAMSRKDYKKALDSFMQAVSTDNKNYLYYYDLGRAQYMLKKFTEAKYSFNTACQLNPSFAPSRYNLGLTNNKLNDAKSALADFRKAHDIDPLHEKAYMEEGRVLFSMKDWNGAVYAYNKAAGINSTNRSAFQELGSSYYQLNNYKEAETAFRKSLALLPAGTDDPLTYYNLSTVLYEQGKADDALNYAKKAYDSQGALRDMNARANIVYNYALICDKTGKVDEAIAKYAEVLQLNPKHLKTQINLGVMYMGMTPPDTEMALSLFKKAYEQDNSSFEANNNLGSAYLSKKDYKNAILHFQNALKIDPKDNEVRINLAQAFASDGQYDNAKTTYMEALRQNPNAWDCYIELAKVCLALNDSGNAAKFLEFVKVKNPGYREPEIDSLFASIK